MVKHKAEGQDIIREHEADGIQEYDNRLPRWWLGLFYLTILFAVVYLARFHWLGGASLREELDASLAKQNAGLAQDESSSSASQAAGVGFEAQLSDPKVIAEGKEAFATNCVSCHGNLGEGGIGPNLTDDYWLHGGSPESIKSTISQGVPAKGMIAWQPILGEQKIIALVAHVRSLRGSTPPNAKAPQGEMMAPNAADAGGAPDAASAASKASEPSPSTEQEKSVPAEGEAPAHE